VPVVIIENGARHFRLMRWGLVPAWVKDSRTVSLLINARSETVKDKPAFKNALKRRRCLIPADGYYEWRAASGPGDRKRPYFIYRRDGHVFALAGLAETWVGPNGEELDTVAIVTAPASEDLAELHDRVPVTIAASDFVRWLDCSAFDVDEIMPLLRASEPGEFTWHEVSSRVNNAVHDDAQLLLPITDEQRAVEEPKPAKKAPRKAASSTRDDDGQGSLF
jgi:putative SOS response-associated peptidase YedK